MPLNLSLFDFQALKFEPYHDSALARFLLTRALLSKRIGHYFFWFLRSEVENLHVSQRYSILLEAYLRGCGPSMIDELSRQTSAVSALQSLSTGVGLFSFVCLFVLSCHFRVQNQSHFYKRLKNYIFAVSISFTKQNHLFGLVRLQMLLETSRDVSLGFLEVTIYFFL